ncbi:polysaccharide deacetylase family protein [Abyssalbus ytuae]|uniref:Polysaccharide deacetylase family protein n=1 Tax=Abyssalbus ytuae TaxID=2926907 RepID=A0A9E6ZWF5_9FLAO|nr:polysaccharide deacetylase family protein [Abyssalbus ytuae]UOB19018.1 polysaccharide deacetylase family protein [Abyssalbus ytuae]
MKLIPKTPGIVKFILSGYIWDIKTHEKSIYLTFDDGPTPFITNWVLDELSKYNAKATFFCIGKNVKTHPEIYKRIIEEGHSTGNHTFDHVKGWKTSVEEYIENTKKTAELVNSNLFRPPYGKITIPQGWALKKLGYKIIMWDVVAVDWDCKLDSETTYNNVINYTAPGSIIVFHDSVKAEKNMKYALTKVLEYFTKKGYTFKCIPAKVL